MKIDPVVQDTIDANRSMEDDLQDEIDCLSEQNESLRQDLDMIKSSKKVYVKEDDLYEEDKRRIYSQIRDKVLINISDVNRSRDRDLQLVLGAVLKGVDITKLEDLNHYARQAYSRLLEGRKG